MITTNTSTRVNAGSFLLWMDFMTGQNEGFVMKSHAIARIDHLQFQYKYIRCKSRGFNGAPDEEMVAEYFSF